MKGIYLTQEGKKEIEARIADYERGESNDEFYEAELKGIYNILKEILSSAIILPVENNWTNALLKSATDGNIIENYPNGVIIQPKS